MSGSINEKIVPKVGRKFDPLEALKIVSQDVQVYRRIAPGPSDNDKDGALPLAYCRPTSKAFMAKKGFLMTETLGSGTYSKVKKAYKYNLKLDPEKLRASKPAKVAVKIIDMNRSPEDYKKKFLPRELGIWPRLNHPYICPLLDTFPDGRFLYMVLPYAPNGDSLTFIQKNGPLTEGQAHTWMAQVTSAVLYLHNRRVCHRDLKLENLLIDAHGDVVLCDFGFVKGHWPDHMDLSSTFCGSLSYAAPEVLKGQPYDPLKSDVWALACVFYIFITGRMPFDESKGAHAMLKEMRDLNFVWPIQPSPQCQSLIKRMFTWEFPKRPDIQEVSADAWFGPSIRSGNEPRPPSAMELAQHAYNSRGDANRSE